LNWSKLRKTDKRYRTWNIMSLYKVGSLKTVASEPEKCKLDLVAIQEVR